MKKIYSLLLSVLLIALSLFPLFSVTAVADDTPAPILDYGKVKTYFEASKNSVTAVFKSSEGTSLPYRMYVPADYDPAKSYPVVLYFHGAGERGNDNTHIFRGGSILQRLLVPAERKNNPCIIIAPQCAANSQWVLSPWDPGTYDHTKIQKSPYMTAAEELLEDVIKNYSVDESRLYVSGISMGGFGTWDLISRYPDKFAAAIPVCGGTDAAYLENLKGFPIRTFHAVDDYIVRNTGTVKAAEILSGHGDFLYTEYSSGGHPIWDRAYKTGNLTEWLFAQKNENVKDEPTPIPTPTPTPSPEESITPDASPTPDKSPSAEQSVSPESPSEISQSTSIIGTLGIIGVGIIGAIVVGIVAIAAIAVVVVVLISKKKK